MDDLEIKIAITYRVPEKDLTLNGLLRGLERDRDEIMRTVLGTILAAVEEKTLENLSGRFVRDGHQSSARTFKTSFGIVRHRMAQVRDETGAISRPLEERLQIVPYRQYQGEELEAAVGQAIHLSYRVAAQETERLKGQGPSKSTLWRRLQDLAETTGAWPPLQHRPFQFLMVDGTKVRLQDKGQALGTAEMRWALASEDVGKPFELVPKPPHKIQGLTLLPMTDPDQPESLAPLTEKERADRLGSFLEILGKSDAYSGVVLWAKNGKIISQIRVSNSLLTASSSSRSKARLPDLPPVSIGVEAVVAAADPAFLYIIF